MKKLVLTLLLVVSAGVFSNTYAQSSKIDGSYTYTSQDEYGNDNHGTIKIAKKEGKYKVSVTPDSSGANMPLESLKVKDNVVTGDLDFDGSYVGISMKIVKGKIEGKATLPDGSSLKFTAKKKVNS